MATETPPAEPTSGRTPGSEPPDGAHTSPHTGVHAPGRARIGVRHLRTDRWWLPPAATAAGLLAFIVYATWRAFAGGDYYAEPYVSPFYSPCLASACVDLHGGARWPLFGEWWPLSPAVIILIVPLGFRMTCYYYRKAYYRAFWASPPACAVAEPHKKYTGETRFPLLLQNLHRYFLYASAVVALILTYEMVLSFRNEDGEFFHMGLGTLVLLVNTVLLWAYTLSCHSCRHIVGGRLKNFSKHPVRYRMWQWIGKLNDRHMLLAWTSLFTVALADLYVYLVASGAFDDPRFF